MDGLPARVLLTAGPALDTTRLRLPQNTKVAGFVPHTAVLPQAALMVTHAGWGTVTAALCHGVPLVCIPDGRDQPDNAARVVAAGSGVRVHRAARRSSIRSAIERGLDDESLKAGAVRLAGALGRRDGADSVAASVESAQGL
jgi:UDP:flavonoid glycosyltransferase YjiC (YdhE family)